ncbi:MAG TPA: hypothetical protein VM597_12755 [Gemmataceae bacterium]|nr:hypothetical protein [Gemmataceae bacterium]
MSRYTLLAWLVLPAFVVADDSKWSTVKGKVSFDDSAVKVPVPGRVNTGAAAVPACAAADKDFKTEEWIVDPKTKGVKNVIVWIGLDQTPAELAKLKAKRADLPGFSGDQVHPALAKGGKTIELDQPCCRFIPRVLVARAGDVLNIKNSANFPHNVFWNSDANGAFNNLIAAGANLEVKNLKAERSPLVVSCTIHPWMKFYLKVFDHPYFAVTNAAGEFEIKNVPVGRGRIVLWHEEGLLTATDGLWYGEPLAVKEKETATRDFKLTPPKP